MEAITSVTGALIAPAYADKRDDCLSDLIVSNHVGSQFAGLSNLVHTNAAAVLAAIANGDAAIIAATQSQALAGIEATNRTGLAGITSTERNGGEGRLVTERTAGETRLVVHQSAAEIRELVNDKATVNLIAIKDTQHQVTKEACETRQQEAEHFAAIQLEACKNNSAVLAAIAECCCEQKELTRAEASATRELILSQNASSLATQLADAKLTIALAKKI